MIGILGVAFKVGNIVFSTHIVDTQTPYCQPHSKKMADAIIWLQACALQTKIAK